MTAVEKKIAIMVNKSKPGIIANVSAKISKKNSLEYENIKFEKLDDFDSHIFKNTTISDNQNQLYKGIDSMIEYEDQKSYIQSTADEKFNVIFQTQSTQDQKTIFRFNENKLGIGTKWSDAKNHFSKKQEFFNTKFEVFQQKQELINSSINVLPTNIIIHPTNSPKKDKLILLQDNKFSLKLHKLIEYENWKDNNLVISRNLGNTSIKHPFDEKYKDDLLEINKNFKAVNLNFGNKLKKQINFLKEDSDKLDDAIKSAMDEEFDQSLNSIRRENNISKLKYEEMFDTYWERRDEMFIFFFKQNYSRTLDQIATSIINFKENQLAIIKQDTGHIGIETDDICDGL